jgi:hypothetical protein
MCSRYKIKKPLITLKKQPIALTPPKPPIGDAEAKFAELVYLLS